MAIGHWPAAWPNPVGTTNYRTLPPDTGIRHEEWPSSQVALTSVRPGSTGRKPSEITEIYNP